MWAGEGNRLCWGISMFLVPPCPSHPLVVSILHFYSFTLVENMSPPTPPKVMIVGAGLGGLMMAALLEKAKIPYIVFERALEVKPLGMSGAFCIQSTHSMALDSPYMLAGALMSLSVNILPVFEQLGLLDELHKMSYPISNMEFFSQNMKKIGVIQVATKEL